MTIRHDKLAVGSEAFAVGADDAGREYIVHAVTNRMMTPIYSAAEDII